MSNLSEERGLLNKAVPNEELIDFIKNLDKSITLSIWSSNSREIIEDILREYDLFWKFKTIACRSNVEMLKPHSEGFSKIYDKNVHKSNYLMVGNSDADRLGAEAAGIDFHLVTMPQFR